MTNRNNRNTSYSSRERRFSEADDLREGSFSSSEVDSRYSRSTAAKRYVREQQQQRRRTKIFRGIGIAVAAVLAMVLITPFAYSTYINWKLNRGADVDMENVLVQTSLTREPFYMVLLGTDQSLFRDEIMETDGVYRTDTVILARIDPVEKRVTLVSMPRDTQVTLPGEGKQKLNAAYTYGGASLTVSTVSDIAGVGISHYALIDMNGLEEVVDALGGIQVNVPIEIWDDEAGGHLEAGPQTLDGSMALVLCRSRNAYADYGNGDMYRAANQRLVVQAIAEKLLASDIGTIASTVNALAGAVQTDLQVSDIIGLAQAFQGMDTENSLWTGNMPTESFYEDEVWYERILQTEWSEMMRRVQAGLPPTADSAVDAITGTVLANAGDMGTTGQSGADMVLKNGTIAVRNGSGVDGLAATVQQRLELMGYTVADIGDADTYDYEQTVVVYEDPDKAEAAQGIVAALGEGHAQENNYEYIMYEDFLVVIGKDYATSTDED